MPDAQLPPDGAPPCELADVSAEWTDQQPGDGTAPAEAQGSAALLCASPVLLLLQVLWRLLPSAAALVTLLRGAEVVGWPRVLPLLVLVLFLRELLSAAASAVVLTGMKWLLVGRLRPSDAFAGAQPLAFLRWRVGRLIHRELQHTFELLRGTALHTGLLRALGTRVSSGAVVESTGALQKP